MAIQVANSAIKNRNKLLVSSWFKPIAVVLLFVALFSCSESKDETALPSNEIIEYTGKLSRGKGLDSDFRSLKKYRNEVRNSLTLNPPVLKMSEQELADSNAVEAQDIALANSQFLRFVRHSNTAQALRNEIMTVRKVLAADLNSNTKAGLASCQKNSCYRVEMYNFFYNMSVVGFVDINSKKVVAINNYSDAQPDLNQQQLQLAIDIAKNSELVKKELESRGLSIEPTMSQIKTSLKNSRCERSHHLCVAPTFVSGKQALWAIVDLTDGDLVGIRWTELGESGPPIEVTERQLENEFVFSQFCEQTRHFSQGDWQFDYQITSSDGLEITDVKYNNTLVMKSAKLLDWHVSYSSREGFGYSDAIGCPLFSSAVVIAYDGPQSQKIIEQGEEKGFAFVQDFRQPPWPTPCNYRYEQRFEFYHDGRFRVAAADYGRGCGTDGTYRPVIRIDLEIGDKQVETVAQWDGQKWQNWQKEQWHLQSDTTQYSTKGYLFKFFNKQQQGYYIEPNRGQFGDGSKGDFAYTYFTVKHAEIDEGANDMMTLGFCCNTDYQQGPEQFMQPSEDLQEQNLVMWYVPQIKNNGTPGEEYCWADTRVENGIKKIKVWPCYAGPMFHPLAVDDEA